MLKLTTALLVLMISFSCIVNGQKTPKAELPNIAKEISDMRDEDQKMRVKWVKQYKKGKKDNPKFDEFTDLLIAKDRANTARMREIVQEYGWPTYKLVGEGPSNSAWLIVQHADRNPLFQAKCLPLLKAAVDDGQANPRNYAYLYDRVHVAKGAMQLYATQSTSNNGIQEGYFQAIEDESNVQKRRAEMGIETSVEDYAASMGFEYTIPTAEEAIERAEKQKSDYALNLTEAKKAIDSNNYSKAAEHYMIVAESYGNVTTEELIEAARVLSVSKHENAHQGLGYLIKAMARGWDGYDSTKNHPDFAYLKVASVNKYNDFVITAEEMKLDR